MNELLKKSIIFTLLTGTILLSSCNYFDSNLQENNIDKPTIDKPTSIDSIIIEKNEIIVNRTYDSFEEIKNEPEEIYFELGFNSNIKGHLKLEEVNKISDSKKFVATFKSTIQNIQEN